MAISGTDKALMYALGNVMRGGASRGGYHSGEPFIWLGGVQVGTIHEVADLKVQMDSLEIVDILDETPNTCTMKLLTKPGYWSAAGVPSLGARVTIRFGSVNNTDKAFDGILLSYESGYDGRPVPAQIHHILHCIDYTYLANRHLVLGRYQTQSATAIAIDLINRYTQGFSTNHVQANLMTVDEITFTNQTVSEALSNLAQRVGAYWYFDYSADLHFFNEDTATDPGPQPITASHPSLNDVHVATDFSQLVNEVYYEGGGSTAVIDCNPGDTIIPIADDAWYPPTGTVVSGPQRLTYTAIHRAGPSVIVGPAASPSAAPGVSPAQGTGVTTGSHQYAYTWVNLNGETLPSPLCAPVGCGTLPTPSYMQAWEVNIQYHVSDEQKGWQVGDTVEWNYSYGVDDGPQYASPPSFSNSVVCHANAYGEWFHSTSTPSPYAHAVRVFYSPNPVVTRIYVWYRINGGPWFVLGWPTNSIVNVPAYALENGGFGYHDYEFSSPGYLSTGGVTYPPTPRTYGQVQVSGIALGPSGSNTTSRRLYRTAVGSTTLKLVASISGNTVTAFTDTVPDGSLGATAPNSDTANIAPPSTGQIVKAGAGSLPVSGTGSFVATGGWLRVGTQVARYTGINPAAGNTLLLISGTATGALTGTVNYGTTVEPLSDLVVPASGDGSIAIPIKQGDDVNILAHAADNALMGYVASILGGDGVIQTYLQDRRLSYDEALSRAKAYLIEHSRALVTLTYTCRDRFTRSGRTVSVGLDVPYVTGLFKIQQVTINRFGPHVFPTYTVTASTDRYSFEDLVRLIRKAQES